MLHPSLAKDSEAYWKSGSGDVSPSGLPSLEYYLGLRPELPSLESFLTIGSPPGLPPPPGLASRPPGVASRQLWSPSSSPPPRSPPPRSPSKKPKELFKAPNNSDQVSKFSTNEKTPELSKEAKAAIVAAKIQDAKKREETEWWNKKIRNLPPSKCECEDHFWDNILRIPPNASPQERYFHIRNTCWDTGNIHRKEKKCQDGCICPIFICPECGN